MDVVEVPVRDADGIHRVISFKSMTVPALPPAQPPKEKKSERNPHDLRMFGRLREIRASAQYLQSLAADELAKALGMDAAARHGRPSQSGVTMVVRQQ